MKYMTFYISVAAACLVTLGTANEAHCTMPNAVTDENGQCICENTGKKPKRGTCPPEHCPEYSIYKKLKRNCFCVEDNKITNGVDSPICIHLDCGVNAYWDWENPKPAERKCKCEATGEPLTEFGCEVDNPTGPCNPQLGQIEVDGECVCEDERSAMKNCPNDLFYEIGSECECKCSLRKLKNKCGQQGQVANEDRCQCQHCPENTYYEKQKCICKSTGEPETELGCSIMETCGFELGTILVDDECVCDDDYWTAECGREGLVPSEHECGCEECPPGTQYDGFGCLTMDPCKVLGMILVDDECVCDDEYWTAECGLEGLVPSEHECGCEECPPGTQYIDGECKAVRECPSGQIEVNRECVCEDEEALLAECPRKGLYQVLNDRCQCECLGKQKLKNVCGRKKQIPRNRSCGCVKCPPGTTYNKQKCICKGGHPAVWNAKNTLAC